MIRIPLRSALTLSKVLALMTGVIVLMTGPAMAENASDALAIGRHFNRGIIAQSRTVADVIRDLGDRGIELLKELLEAPWGQRRFQMELHAQASRIGLDSPHRRHRCGEISIGPDC